MLKIVYYYRIKRIYTDYTRSLAIVDHEIRQCHSLRPLVTCGFSALMNRICLITKYFRPHRLVRSSNSYGMNSMCTVLGVYIIFVLASNLSEHCLFELAALDCSHTLVPGV